MAETGSQLTCSFCGITTGLVVAGPNGAGICRECLNVVTQLKDDGDRPAVRTSEPGAET